MTTDAMSAPLAALRGLTPRQLPAGELHSALRAQGLATSQAGGRSPG